MAVVGTTFNVFGYDAVLDRDSNLLPIRQRADALYVTQQSRVIALSAYYLTIMHSHIGRFEYLCHAVLSFIMAELTGMTSQVVHCHVDGPSFLHIKVVYKLKSLNLKVCKR